MSDSTKKTNRPPAKGIFPNEAWEMISKNRKGDDLIIKDVSTPYEYKDKHLDDAINLNLFWNRWWEQLLILSIYDCDRNI